MIYDIAIVKVTSSACCKSKQGRCIGATATSVALGEFNEIEKEEHVKTKNTITFLYAIFSWVTARNNGWIIVRVISQGTDIRSSLEVHRGQSCLY